MSSLRDPICTVEGCQVLAVKRGLCGAHYRRHAGKVSADTPIRKRPATGVCRVDGCGRAITSREHGLCDAHHYRLKKHGDPNGGRPLAAYRARDGKGSVDPNGYRILYRPGHPNAGAQGHIKEHRFVMSEHIGRPLFEHENVHHLNGDKLDNRVENLELWSRSQPWGQRVTDKVSWATDILQRYAPERLSHEFAPGGIG